MPDLFATWQGKQKESAAEALEQMPGGLAALIRRAPTSESLAVCLFTLTCAQTREEISHQSGRFGGLLAGTWVAMPANDARKWSADEFEALMDYGNEMAARALSACVDGQ